MPDPKTIYRLLLKLYPARFREEYETPLERQFWDEYREIEGGWPRAVFWLRALADLAVSIPAELLRELRQDLGFAARVYRQRRVATGLALAALALAIGVTTGVFSVLNALLLRSLPFRDPERLAEVRNSPQYGPAGGAAFHAWRGSTAYLEDAAIYTSSSMSLSHGGAAVRVRVTEASSNFFSVLGTEPEFGRAFAAGEDAKGSETLAIVSHGIWEQTFGSDPRVLGAGILLNGAPATVVGVAPPSMDYPERTAVWTATVFDAGRLPKEVAAILYTTIGRVRPGLSMAQAGGLLLAEVARRHPGDRPARSVPVYARPQLVPLRDQLAGPGRKASLVLMGVVVFVLLIACANVAHLLLSRITERRQELVVRSALGASHGRLVQQLITESTMLTLAAAAAGLAVARWASGLASLATPAGLAVQQYTILDWRVLLFAVALALATGLLFGVLPASLIARLQPAEDLLRAQPRAYGTGVRRLRGLLLAMQAAFTVILLAGAASLGRTFLRLTGTDLGFDTSHVVTFTVSLAGSRPAAEHRMGVYYRALLERLRAVPGVISAGAVEHLPLAENTGAIFGFRLGAGAPVHGASLNIASPDYFRTMGIPLLAGREFNSGDRVNSRRVAIVTDRLARELGGGESVLGRDLLFDPGGGPPDLYAIVGVVRTPLTRGPQGPPTPQVFRPSQQVSPEFLTFVAKVRGKSEPYLALCREAARQNDPTVAAYNLNTMDSLLSETLARPRFYTTAMLFFGGFALLVALIGIHGVASHWIVLRTHEIGVRLAMGSSPRGLRAMLLRQGLAPAAVGILAGLAGAAGFEQVLQHLVEDVDPLNIATCAAAAGLLAVTAAAAVWRATRRIVLLDPMRVLRAE